MTAAAAAGGYSNTPSGPAVQLHDQNITKAARSTATVSYVIAADGKVKNQAGTILEAWLLSGAASSYEVMASITSGAITSGTTDVWLGCGSDRTWSVSNSAQDNSTVTAVLSVRIRNASTGAVLAGPAAITLNATSIDAGGGGGFGGGGGL